VKIKPFIPGLIFIKNRAYYSDKVFLQKGSAKKTKNNM
jgi:hypothetical protein